MLKVYIVISLLITILFSGCGYKPSSKFSRKVVGEKISTSITISSKDPENTVVIKDAIDMAIIEVFHASLRSRAKSDTHLELSASNPSYSPILYDDTGFITGYRMQLSLSIKRTHNGISKSYTTTGAHDFSVTPNAVVTDQERFEAIQLSAIKAIRAFLAKVSAEGARIQKEKK